MSHLLVIKKQELEFSAYGFTFDVILPGKGGVIKNLEVTTKHGKLFDELTLVTDPEALKALFELIIYIDKECGLKRDGLEHLRAFIENAKEQTVKSGYSKSPLKLKVCEECGGEFAPNYYAQRKCFICRKKRRIKT